MAAITAATAATIAAATSLAATAATTTMSFVQAGKQKKAQRQAEKDADEAMANARKKLETNFYAAQGIQKEPYELEREALLSQGAGAIQAGVESERGAAATAGRVQLAQQQGQAAVRSAMGQEMMALENKQLAEESRLRDIGVQLDLGEVEGAQLAAANAERLRAQSIEQGMQGVTSFAKQAAAALPLFSGGAADVSGVSATPLEKAEYMPRTNLTMPAAPQTINPNLQPANIMPIKASNTINPSLQPANISPIGGDARLPYQGYQAPLPLYLQNQQGFRFNNPYTYNDPFNIYGKRN
jgi:hypothetical protein